MNMIGYNSGGGCDACISSFCGERGVGWGQGVTEGACLHACQCVHVCVHASVCAHVPSN